MVIQKQSMQNIWKKIAKKIESGVSVYDKDEVIEKKHTLTINHLSVFLGVFILGVFLIINAFIYSFTPTFSFIIYLVSYLCIGGKVIFKAIKNISRGQIFDENFLMMIATIGAFFISEYIEGIAVMLFYQIGEYFQDLAVHRSRNNIESLMDLKPNVAHLFHDELIDEVKPEDLKINDVVLVKPGEKNTCRRHYFKWTDSFR